jgi:hypothetical protein
MCKLLTIAGQNSTFGVAPVDGPDNADANGVHPEFAMHCTSSTILKVPIPKIFLIFV